MTQASPLVFGSSRLPIEFDPYRLPQLPTALGTALCLPLALGAAFAADALLRTLPMLQSSGANTLFALALLGGGATLLRQGPTTPADALIVLAALLAVLPLLQAIASLHPADGPWRVLLETRRAPGVAGHWPGCMSLSSSLALLLAVA